jgi:CheY-like chemotaxis protein
VEDEATNRMIAEVILQTSGHQVTTAENGHEALSLCHDLGLHFDLVLMDVQMPVMDGYEAAQRMRAHPGTRHLPIVYLSARAGDDDVADGFASGGDAYITKPYSRLELLWALDGALKRRCAL